METHEEISRVDVCCSRDSKGPSPEYHCKSSKLERCYPAI